MLQILFGVLYIVNLAIVLFIYVKTDVVYMKPDFLSHRLFFFHLRCSWKTLLVMSCPLMIGELHILV